MSDTGIQRIYRHESTQFTTVPNWVVRDPNYSPNAFRLLAYLLSHSNGYELTYQQIQRQTTLGRYAINEAAKFLIEQGWLVWEQNKGQDGRYLAKTWIIKDPQANHPLSDDSAVESFHYGTTNGHKEEQLLEKNTNKEENSQDNALFSEFWSLYPVKKDKAKAFRAFKAALKRAKFEEIIAGVLLYKDDPLRDPEFTKYPATWLNSDSWENYYEPSPQSEAARRASERRERELQRTNDFLAEIRAQEEQAKPAPQCPHGQNVALCKRCINA